MKPSGKARLTHSKLWATGLGSTILLYACFSFFSIFSCSKPVFLNNSSKLQVSLIDTSISYLPGDSIFARVEITNLDTLDLRIPIQGELFRLIRIQIDSEWIGLPEHLCWFAGARVSEITNKIEFIYLKPKEERVFNVGFTSKCEEGYTGGWDFNLCYMVEINMPEEKTRYHSCSDNVIWITRSPIN